MEIHIEVPINPSESREKVEQTLPTFVDQKLVDKKIGDAGIELQSGDARSLRPMKEALKKQLIRDAARAVLRAGLRGGVLEFRLHKQAAFVKRVSFVTEESESPLGPIRVTVIGSQEELTGLIKYLTGEERGILRDILWPVIPRLNIF